MIALIDYGMGNLPSVEKALEALGGEVRRAARPEEAENCSGLVLPGVGNFGDGMKNLRERNFVPFIREYTKNFDRPFLGICLGMQMLLESSEEAPGEEGLGIFPGRAKLFPAKDGFKVPHMGWNQVEHDGTNPFLKNVPSGAHFYFVHSYCADAKSPDTAAVCDYILPFAAALGRGSVFATQFHPEKSQLRGRAILENFMEKVKETEMKKSC